LLDVTQERDEVEVQVPWDFCNLATKYLDLFFGF
jgi:hypothetical protein